MRHIIYFFIAGGIIILLYLHFRLSITRYFDADEFAHLHWGYVFSIGEKPYRDFFYLFPPLFLYPIALIVKLFGRTFDSLIAARVFIFISYVGVVGILGLIVNKMRGLLAALFAVFIFVFLPMPQDKMIEVRPDLVAVLFGLLGIWFFIKANESGIRGQGSEIFSRFYYIVSGFSYGLSLAFVPKTVFFLIPIVVIWVYRIINHARGNPEKDLIRNILSFGTGLSIPALFILGFILWTGKAQLALYSMTKMASTVTAILGQKFYMFPSHFFWPTDVYYGSGGFNPALYTTLVIFLLASVVGVLRGVASLSYKNKSRCISEFLIFSSFYAMLFAFVKIFPLKHAQYWIPVIPFFCFYIGDVFQSFLFFVLRLTNNEQRTTIHRTINNRLPYVLILFPIICLLTYLGSSVYQNKLKWNNTETQAKIEYFLTKIPENEPVFDLTGETVFFRDGYYFCCVPYGQYEEGIGFDIPDIAAFMNSTLTQYVHVGYEGRLGVLARNQNKYIDENFQPLSDNLFLWKIKS